MAAAFAVLFVMYSKYRSRYIFYGHDDQEIVEELQSRLDNYNSKHTKVNAQEYLKITKKRSFLFSVISAVVYGIFLAVILAFAITATVFRAQGKQFFFGKTTYLTVLTGSMSEINPYNPYAKQIPAGEQIPQYALIGIEQTDEEIKLFDVVAFHYQNDVYIHRVVKISDGANGAKIYTTMGDANNASFPFETSLTREDIIGRYNGSCNAGFGMFLTYLQSNMGIITMSLAAALFIGFDVSQFFIEKTYRDRLKLLAKNMGEEVDESAFGATEHEAGEVKGDIWEEKAETDQKSGEDA